MSNVQKQIEQVANFMKVAGQETHTKFAPVSLGVAKLRHTLINEEITGKNEFEWSAQRDDLVGMLDGMCDILYVVYGAALTFGIDMSAFDYEAPSVANGKLSNAANTLRVIKSLKSDADKFEHSYEYNEYDGIADSLANIVATIFDYAADIQVDLAGAFNEVHESNMSKFSETEEHAHMSAQVRSTNGDKKYDDVYVTHSTVDGITYWMIKRNEDHKILKSLNFFEPDLSVFVK